MQVGEIRGAEVGGVKVRNVGVVVGGADIEADRDGWGFCSGVHRREEGVFILLFASCAFVAVGASKTSKPARQGWRPEGTNDGIVPPFSVVF